MYIDTSVASLNHLSGEDYDIELRRESNLVV